MDCRKYLRRRSVFPHNVDSLPEILRQHLRTCGDCARLEENLGETNTERIDLEHVQKNIAAILLDDLQPVRPLPSPGRRTLMLIAIAAGITACIVWQMKAFGWEKMSGTQAAVTFGTLAALVLATAATISIQMAPGGKQWCSPLSLFAVVLSALPVVVPLLYPEIPDERFAFHAVRCWALGTSCAALTAVFLWWLILRRGFPLNAGLHFASAGMFAGLAGIAVLELHCPLMDAAHKIAGHATIVLTTALAGLIASSRVSLR